jgi:hypothetical protein
MSPRRRSKKRSGGRSPLPPRRSRAGRYSRKSRRLQSRKRTTATRTYRAVSQHAVGSTDTHTLMNDNTKMLFPPPCIGWAAEKGEQCGVLCDDGTTCACKRLNPFCVFHTTIHKNKTKEYKISATSYAMQKIKDRFCLYFMFHSASNHNKNNLSEAEKDKLSTSALGHLKYISDALLPKWEPREHGPKPNSAIALLHELVNWTPKQGELVRAEYKRLKLDGTDHTTQSPTSQKKKIKEWKLAEVLNYEPTTRVVSVRFAGYPDRTELLLDNVRPPYIAMPSKTIFLDSVDRGKMCIVLLKGSGALRDMELTCLPDQPDWNMMAFIYYNKCIGFTNIISKDTNSLTGEVTLDLPPFKSTKIASEEAFQLDIWYDADELMKTNAFAMFMDDENSQVLATCDIKATDVRKTVDYAKVVDPAINLITHWYTIIRRRQGRDDQVDHMRSIFYL